MVMMMSRETTQCEYAWNAESKKTIVYEESPASLNLNHFLLDLCGDPRAPEINDGW